MTSDLPCPSEPPDRRRLTLFLVIGFAFSWIVWAPLTISALRGGAAWPYWHLLGGLGPAVAGLLVTRLEGEAGWRGLLGRLDPRRTRLSWLAFGALAPVALYAIAVVLLGLGGQGWPRLRDFGASREYPELGRSVYWLANLVFYGLGEEIGWRGYLLPRLQRRMGARAAACVVTVIWALWHLPLFAFAAGMRAMGPAEIVGWFLSLLTGSFLLTWILNSSGSIVAVALFHGVLDITMGSPGHPMTMNIMGALLTVGGIAVAVATGPGLRWPRDGRTGAGEDSDGWHARR